MKPAARAFYSAGLKPGLFRCHSSGPLNCVVAEPYFCIVACSRRSMNQRTKNHDNILRTEFYHYSQRNYHNESLCRKTVHE